MAPLYLNASEISSREFILSWTAPASTDRNGILRYYILSVSEYKSGLLSLEEVSIEAVSNVTGFTVGYLIPYTLYNCSVAAVTIDRGPLAVIQVRTGEEGTYNNYVHDIDSYY